MTAVHLIVTSFQVFFFSFFSSPPRTPLHPTPIHPSVSVLLCCFKICMSLSGMPVTGPNFVCPNLPHDEMILLKAGSICLNLHSSPSSTKAFCVRDATQKHA
ncbi:hypothetical protein AMECASPLE_003054 [Ameca splendens]|uniref:Secreted protein n=1 Tax=Ameca splendens TaxID=208324 RepID=A0ABV0YKJ0_9TELE